jgi:di/tricarboxylate transporter
MQLQCRRCGKGQRNCGCGILDHSAIKELPWAIVVLLGGGFALAEASKVTEV